MTYRFIAIALVTWVGVCATAGWVVDRLWSWGGTLGAAPARAPATSNNSPTPAPTSIPATRATTS